jgi:NAD(P)-dependent dehydrogenase (short-subunit alcohol dehydrogenase family)
MEAQRHVDRTVVVTGAASGIGRGIAIRFGTEGANVLVADVRREPKRGERYDTDATVALVCDALDGGDASRHAHCYCLPFESHQPQQGAPLF